MNSSGTSSQSQGACGGQVEEAEDEESSSSSTSTVLGEDELENFRQKWKQDLGAETKPQNLREERLSESESEVLTIEDKATVFFMEGVEHEQNGELYEAIQKYRKAINLVPDIEFKVFELNKRRRGAGAQPMETTEEASVKDDSDDDVDEIPNEDIETVEDTDLLVKFSKMKLKNQPKSTGICEKEYETSINGHISQMPVEVLIYILKWMVSSELDLKSLENFSEACRGFFVISRVSDLWRRICIQTWGVAGLPLEEPTGLGGWRTLFLTQPRVNFNGCYISRVTYLRQGERGFQDNEFYKSWHVVHYHRFLRFFPGGRVLMVTSAEDPAAAVKMLNNRYNCAIQGCLFGHYRTVNNRIHCVMQKAEPPPTNNRRLSLRQRKARNQYMFEVPDQDFHSEFEIKGKRNQHLHWLCYNVISKYKDGREQLSDMDISNKNNYPTMVFSRAETSIYIGCVTM